MVQLIQMTPFLACNSSPDVAAWDSVKHGVELHSDIQSILEHSLPQCSFLFLEHRWSPFLSLFVDLKGIQHLSSMTLCFSIKNLLSFVASASHTYVCLLVSSPLCYHWTVDDNSWTSEWLLHIHVNNNIIMAWPLHTVYLNMNQSHPHSLNDKTRHIMDFLMRRCYS